MSGKNLNNLKNETLEDIETTVIFQNRSAEALSRTSKLISDCIFAEDGVVFCVFGKSTATGAYLHMPDSQEGFDDFVNCMIERAQTDKNFEGYVKSIQYLINHLITQIDENQNTKS